MFGLKAAYIWTGAISLLFILFLIWQFSPFANVNYKVTSLPGEQFAAASDLPPPPPPVVHLATPEQMKSIYMTSCVAGTPSWREQLKALIERTELNSIVIDIKDYTGTVSFPNNLPKPENRKGCVVSDLKEFIASLHQSNIYVIGRISVFQDPAYTSLFPELAVKSLSTGGVWKDNKGLAFIDVGATPYWDYIVDISKQAYAIGFDELNYDYVRYPSDGNMKDANYSWSNSSTTVYFSKADRLETFFIYLHQHLKDLGVKTSADLFGMTTTIQEDMGIGQVLEKALPYFDYIDPMVYPSHYPATWNGFANPAEHPYEVIHIAMSEGKRREQILNISMGLATTTPSKLRPWIQDFNLGATYGPDKVRAQMQATYDSGLTSWMIWSAANKYTEAALLP
ncbi:putative glycoside hydrolase [Candidatus Parcubacteria bacterium]|nr:putative glycoside hydrolase [Candidatus Parcubacteria bacterium]